MFISCLIRHQHECPPAENGLKTNFREIVLARLDTYKRYTYEKKYTILTVDFASLCLEIQIKHVLF